MRARRAISHIQAQLNTRHFARLASRLARLQRASERLLDARHELFGAERPAARFRGAQRIEGRAFGPQKHLAIAKLLTVG